MDGNTSETVTLLSSTLLGIPITLLLYSFVAVLGGFLLRWGLSHVIASLMKAASKTNNKIDDVVLAAIVKPIGWACVVGGIYVGLIILPLPQDTFDIKRFIDALMRSFSVILVVWGCVTLVDGLMNLWAEAAEKTDTRLDDQMVPIVRSSAKTFLIIIGVVLFLQNMGYSVTSLVAGLGLGGMAIALASKDTVANLFGSIVLFVDRPFQIGDVIELNKGGVKGTVEEIGLRTTRIRTYENSLITMPNATFTTNPINNWSRRNKRRIVMNIGVTYDTPPEKIQAAVEDIRTMIHENDEIDPETRLVNFTAFNDSSLGIMVYCFTKTTKWDKFLEVQQGLMLDIMYKFQELGIEFAFPTQTIHVDSMPGAPETIIRQQEPEGPVS